MSYKYNPPAAEVHNLLRDAKIIAMVGASANPSKASHGVMRILQRAGYRVIPVNPNETEILGEKSYASLRDIPEKVDIVDVFRRAETTPDVAEDAVAIGAKTLWLQLGIENEEAGEIARKAGLNVIMDSCIAIVLGQMGVAPPHP